MAKTGDRIPGSNRDRVRAFLAANPGKHRCTEIAAATGLSTHQVAIAARGLWESGAAERGTRPAGNEGRPFNTYEASSSLLAAAPDPANT